MPSETLRQFDIFAQLVAAGDLARCAHDLGLPLATVQSELATLEERLGYSLFAQDGGTLMLTPAGRKAVSAMAHLVDRPDSSPVVPEAAAYPAPLTENALTDPPPPSTGHDLAHPSPATALIRPPQSFRPLPSARGQAPDILVQNIVLAAHPAIFAHFQETLTAFEQSSPDVGITLRLEGLDEAAVLPLFAQERADIAYFYALGETPFPSRYAWSERISLYAAADHPLAQANDVLAEDFSTVAYVALAQGNLHRHLAEGALHRAGLAVPPPRFESDNLFAVMEQVRAGQGWFPAFGTLARDFGKMPGIARIAYTQGLPQVEVRQALREGANEDAAIAALAEFLFR